MARLRLFRYTSPFTATNIQVITYLFGIALFSIAFLVFLNSATSFVITDLIPDSSHAAAGTAETLKTQGPNKPDSHPDIGNAVGTLGFADELVALVACPTWGLLSDRIGLRAVSVTGFLVVALALSVFVQARNVYPQLLLARMLFSIGGAATSTMVTAILPTMTMSRQVSHESSSASLDEYEQQSDLEQDSDTPNGASQRRIPFPQDGIRDAQHSSGSETSIVAGTVGMFTGCGALLALVVFLPLPARFQKNGSTPAHALEITFYIVSAVALCTAGFCAWGLRNLPGESGKGWLSILGRYSTSKTTHPGKKMYSYRYLLREAFKLGFKDSRIGLGYLGGFVARASSVAITAFIPVFVNAYFISSGICDGDPSSTPGEIKEQCRRAYVVASILSGVSQLVALLFAPIFGVIGSKYKHSNAPLLLAALCGVMGYLAFAQISNPDPVKNSGAPGIMITMSLIGISQIGAIVCSLSLLSRGIQQATGNSTASTGVRNAQRDEDDVRNPESMSQNDEGGESNPLLDGRAESYAGTSRSHLKGSIAGLYSLAGGAGILLLTKLGGYLFGHWSYGAPFYLMAIFNGILFVVGSITTVASR